MRLLNDTRDVPRWQAGGAVDGTKRGNRGRSGRSKPLPYGQVAFAVEEIGHCVDRGCINSLSRLRRSDVCTIDCHVGLRPPRNDTPRTFAPRSAVPMLIIPMHIFPELCIFSSESG